MGFLGKGNTPESSNDAQIDAAIAAALEADPAAHAIMHAHMPSVVPALSLKEHAGGVDPQALGTQDLIGVADITAEEEVVMRRRFPKLAFA